MRRKIGNKGQAVQFLWIVGALAIILMPIVIGLVLIKMIPGMPAIIYYTIGYVSLLLLDFIVAKAVFKLPFAMALGISLVLPFLQTGIATMAIGGGV